jgi:hypothetical protein
MCSRLPKSNAGKTGFDQASEKEDHKMMGMRCRNKLKGTAEQFANT